MCGIAGVLSLNKNYINLSYTKFMLDKIAHRGPDDAGYLYFQTGSKDKKNISYYQNLTDNNFMSKESRLQSIESSSIQKKLKDNEFDLYMGHRRLSILDVSIAGHQPMSDISANIWISFNGEIFNFMELKLELQKLGYSFRSNTDTEVIIYSYIHWGIDCINKFNGMFVFSLYDNLKKKFYLCRDRYGIKPVYYHISNDKTFVYGSEIKSILEYRFYQRQIDKDALVEYFTFQNIFTNKTFHKNIQILEAGNFLKIDLNTKDYKKIKYWDFDFNESEKFKDQKECAEELNRLFSKAVKRQLISDVSVGSYLSGGIDSSSIVSVASNHFQKNKKSLKTFTIGFDLSSASGLELSFDERENAQLLANKFKTDHYTMLLKSGDMENCLSKFAYHLEEPRVGQSYPNFYAAKLASKYVKVVLSGSGGDELFAGYPWRYFRFTNNKNFDGYIDKYYKFWQRLIPNKEINNLFSPISSDLKNIWTRDIFKNVFKKSSLAQTPEEYINQSLYFEAKTFLHGLLVVEDKLSMAHSLETRVPFLDNELVDFAQKIPINFKLKELNKMITMDENEISKFNKTNDGKIILRESIKKYIPKNIYNATKQGFSSPDGSWFKGKSIDFVKKKLFKENTIIYEYIDKEVVKRLVNEHFDGKKNRRLLIWSFLNFQEWAEQYM